MDELVISRAPVAVSFSSPRRDGSDDPYAGESFVVTIAAEGLQTSRHVFMFGFDWAALSAFFADLAESWKGWQGEKAWHSIEHDLEITATADGLGHCDLAFEVRDGPAATWAVRVSEVRIDAGEDLSNLARGIAAWVPQMPGEKRHSPRGPVSGKSRSSPTGRDR